MKNITLLAGIIFLVSLGFFLTSPPTESNQTPHSQVTAPIKKPAPESKVVAIKEPQAPLKESIPQKGSITAKPVPALDKELEDELADIMENGYGSLPEVDLSPGAMNPHKESILEAIKTGKFPERLSITAKRPEFDVDAYWNDPSSYLNIIELGRPFDTAHPGADVARIKRLSSKYIEAEQGKTVEISVGGLVKNAPVSALSSDGGHFSSGLSATTIQADASGTATFQYTPTQGVIQNVRISIGSPLSSGTLRHTVYVKKGTE